MAPHRLFPTGFLFQTFTALQSSYSIHLVPLRSQEMAPGLSSAPQRRSCQGRAAAAASASSPHLHISRRPLLYKSICICLLFPHTSSLRREEKSLLLGKFDAFACALDSLSLQPPQGPYVIRVPFCDSSSDIPCLLAPQCINTHLFILSSFPFPSPQLSSALMFPLNNQTQRPSDCFHFFNIHLLPRDNVFWFQLLIQMSLKVIREVIDVKSEKLFSGPTSFDLWKAVNHNGLSLLCTLSCWFP